MKRKGTNMEDNRIIECIERANYILGNLMAVTEKDEVLIVIDDQTDRRMANAMAGAAKSLGAEYGIYQMPVRGKDQATIFPKSLELGMDACTVFVGMTTGSGAAIYNNHLKELINQKKLREVSICLRSIDNFTHTTLRAASIWRLPGFLLTGRTMRRSTLTARSCRRFGADTRWRTSPRQPARISTWR